MLHRFATFVAGCTVLLVLAGSLVTSTGSGLSVPDWPTSYGWNMLTFPPSKWVGGILYEHGHRLIATTVGMLTIVLAAWLWLREPRRWMKWMGATALGAVIAQGVLGGLTVLFFLPAAISTAHAALAEIFFCLVVSIALFTSPRWIEGYDDRGVRLQADLVRLKPDPTYGLRRIATATTAIIYVQILLGATMRHTGAGLAIPDFPLVFGGLVPPAWDAKIAIHYSHRIGAMIVIVSVVATAWRIWSSHSSRRELMRPAALLLALTAIQIALGGLNVLSRLSVWINSVHVVCGALVLTTSLVLTLRCWRSAFGQAVTASEAYTVRLPPSRAERTSASHAEARGEGGKPDATVVNRARA